MRLFVKVILLCVNVLMLCQCQKIAEGHPQQNNTVATPFSMPAKAYLAMAANQTGDERNSLLLQAAGRLIYDGQWQEGERILSQLSSAKPTENDEKKILQAKVALFKQHYQEAVSTLSEARAVNHLPLFYQIQYHEILAYAYQAEGKPMESLIERIGLEHLYGDDVSRANNRRLIWLSLTTLSTPELNAIAQEVAPKTELDGWVQLALIPRQYGDNGLAMAEALEAFSHHHPNHPALYILPPIDASLRAKLFAPPHRIALLLPMTGALAGPSGAIRDGFMSALAESPRRGEIDVAIYDTNVQSAGKLYDKAISEGADFVVGPLSKKDVAAVASKQHPVPTLLLNDIEGSPSANAYEFGLSPQDEARQVAATARKHGFSRALLIAPVGDWGQEVVNAFSQQWQSNGGVVVDQYRYSQQGNLQQGIKDLLRASGQSLTKKTAKPVQASKRRRNDFDMIFLVAYPSHARQIMPTLRYYFAGNVPVYATSSVYGGSLDSQHDRDLDGVQFCDMPWVFSHQAGNRHWPEKLNSYNRLYAMGMDSFALTTKLNQLLIFPAMGVSEQSGMLYLKPNQQIARVLAWGQFRQGVAYEKRDGR